MRKPSKHDISEAEDIFSKDEPRQKSPEGESPRIQRLAKSGLYINPSDALKFFSTQVDLIYLHNYFNLHVSPSFSLVRRHSTLQFLQSDHKMSLIKVALYLLRVKNMHSWSPSDLQVQ